MSVARPRTASDTLASRRIRRMSSPIRVSIQRRRRAVSRRIAADVIVMPHETARRSSVAYARPRPDRESGIPACRRAIGLLVHKVETRSLGCSRDGGPQLSAVAAMQGIKTRSPAGPGIDHRTAGCSFGGRRMSRGEGGCATIAG